MYKKAGIIIGIAIIVIAIVIFLIASAASKSGEGTTSQVTTSVSEVASQPVQNTSSAANTAVPTPPAQTTAATSAAVVAPVVTTTTSVASSAEPVESTPVESQDTTVQTGASLIEIDSSTLPAYVDETDVGTVVGRRVYAYNGQVIYSLLVNTTVHGQLEYFTTLVNYNIADGTRVSLDLRVFNASNGSYVSVISMTTV